MVCFKQPCCLFTTKAMTYSQKPTISKHIAMKSSKQPCSIFTTKAMQQPKPWNIRKTCFFITKNIKFHGIFAQHMLFYYKKCQKPWNINPPTLQNMHFLRQKPPGQSHVTSHGIFQQQPKPWNMLKTCFSTTKMLKTME